MVERRLAARTCLAVLLLGGLSSVALAQNRVFSEDGIDVFLVSEPKGDARYGYGEYTFLIANAAERSRQVALTLPAEEAGGDSVLRELRRTVEVEAQGTAVLTLYQPALPLVSGSGMRVHIDGKAHKTLIPLNVRNIARPDLTGPAISFHGATATASPAVKPLVLVGPSVKAEAVELLRVQRGRMMDPGFPDRLPPIPGENFPPGPRLPPEGPERARRAPEINFEHFETIRADVPLRAWSNHWLGYSRYDAVLLTAKDLRELPETSRPALWQYVECGGILLIAGTARVADGWKGIRHGTSTIYLPGFGACVVGPASHEQWDEDFKDIFRTLSSETAVPFKGDRSVMQPNQRLPVIDDVGIPVRGLFVLMVLFVIVIGPVNLTLLSRWKRRLWLLWTVPTIAALTVGAVFGYMLIAEGWSRHQRTELITIKDENTGRATTIGWTSFYSPITPNDGLRFSYDTEVTLLGDFDESEDRRYGRRRRSSRSCTIDLTSDQHLDRGWMRARLPTHFLVRKSEPRRERVLIRRNRDGSFTATNALGASVSTLWFADEKGKLHSAEGIPAGGEVPLKALEETALPSTARFLRSLYAADWLDSAKKLRAEFQQALHPLTYLAEVEDSPFLEDGLARTKFRRCRTIVVGILKGLEHES